MLNCFSAAASATTSSVGKASYANASTLDMLYTVYFMFGYIYLIVRSDQSSIITFADV